MPRIAGTPVPPIGAARDDSHRENKPSVVYRGKAVELDLLWTASQVRSSAALAATGTALTSWARRP